MFIAALFFAACGGGEVTPEKEEPKPTPESKEPLVIPSSENLSPSFDANGGTATVSFTANADWVASVTNTRAESWCTVSPVSGSKGNHSLQIKASANNDPDSRSAVVQLKSGAITKNINVSQKQKDALTITADRFEVAKEGGIVEIEVKANVQVTYSIDDKSKGWVSYVGTRALKTSYISFKVAENTSSEKREATITLTNGTLSEKVKIYQAGGDSPSIVITKSEYTVSSAGENIQVEVASNVDVEVVMPGVDWIKENTTRAMSTHTYHYIISPNESYESRSAEIIFRNKENNLQEKVKISQAQKDAIILAENEYYIKADATQLSFEVSSNVDYRVSIDCDWIKEVSTKALSTETLKFDISENKETAQRTGKIRISSGTVSQEVRVVQSGKVEFSISTEMIEVGADKCTFEFAVTSSIGYKVEPSVDWIKQISVEGEGVYKHTFEVSANTSSQPREGVVVVCNDNQVCIPVKVKQAGFGAGLTIAKKDYTVGSEGETIKVEVSSNVEIEVVMPEVDWIKETSTRAMSVTTYYYTVLPNETYDVRKAEIIFRNRENDLEEKVSVSQAQKDAIILAKNEYLIGSGATQLSFDVSSNVEYEVSVDCNWITEVSTKGLTASTLEFNISENKGDSPRTGNITVSNGTINQKVSVIQSGKAAFSITPTMVEVPAAKSTFNIMVTSSIGYEVKPDATWIREISSSGSNGVYTHTFEASANTSTTAREGIIVVCNDEQTCIPVTVKQAGAEPEEEEDMGWVNKKFYHRSLAMRFTADWCGYCPIVAENMETYERLYPNKIEAVSMHASGGLMFSGVQPMVNLYKITGFPTGILDSRVEYYSTESIKQQVDLTEANYPTQTGVSYESKLSGNSLTIDLKIYAKAADKYKVTILLLEDNIVGYQSGKGDNYVHNDVVRMALTDLLGDDCSTTKKNQIVKKRYTATIPGSYRKENMRILVYVQRPFGSQPIVGGTSFGNYYVDNSVSGKLGANLKLGTVEDLSGDGNEDIIPGDEIEF